MLASPSASASPTPLHTIYFISPTFFLTRKSLFAGRPLRHASPIVPVSSRSIHRTACRRSLRGALRRQESPNAAIQLCRLMGDVGRQLFREFGVAAVGQLLRIARNRGQRRAQLQRHLGGNLPLQLLLAPNLFQFAEIVD